MKFIVILFCFNILILLVQSTPLDNNQNDQGVRNKECKYDKEPWSECDSTSNLQKRILKLKTILHGSQCEPTREYTRQCKNVCRYNKGVWSECGSNGEKTRVDTLRSNGIGTGISIAISTNISTGECEPTRITKKRCKQPSNCKYSKSDWSPCENGQKSKTLMLEQGETSECEEKKIITKQCNLKKNKNGSRRMNRKKTKKDRNDKKQEVMTTVDEPKDIKDASSVLEESKDDQ